MHIYDGVCVFFSCSNFQLLLNTLCMTLFVCMCISERAYCSPKTTDLIIYLCFMLMLLLCLFDFRLAFSYFGTLTLALSYSLGTRSNSLLALSQSALTLWQSFSLSSHSLTLWHSYSHSLLTLWHSLSLSLSLFLSISSMMLQKCWCFGCSQNVLFNSERSLKHQHIHTHTFRTKHAHME